MSAPKHNRAELLARLNGRRVVASVSGGKDSAALSLYLHELGIDHDRVFLDTGWEHPITYKYLRTELPRVIGPVRHLRATEDMVELIRRKGVFPSRQFKWCTDELKLKPMASFLRALMDEGHEVVNAVGIRRDESKKRAAAPEWEESKALDCEVWRPLVEWTEADVIMIHKRHGLSPNPLYLRGATRVGCWPCVQAKKAEIRLIADTDPAAIDRIRELERELSERAGKQRAWFPAFIGRKGLWNIDRVVEWSRTKQGGKEFEPYVDTEAGCMRWGMCEAPSSGP